jgi:16S rRNA C967 or C1407 C5-methylase (RsmB/RsmF family)/NOL1/NOP2/fmu family ribosome biogenesis protein
LNPTEKQLPGQFKDQMKSLLNQDEFQAFMQSQEDTAPVSIRLHPEKGNHLFRSEKSIPWEPLGKYLDQRPSFTLDPNFHGGAYYVQEAASMFLGHALDQVIDWKMSLNVLDLCAAPGGKSTQLLSRISPESVLISNEIDYGRFEILLENLSKWGYTQQIATAKAPNEFESIHELFDLMVVDAPCSGEGMMRKDIQAISHWSPNNVLKCQYRQKDILTSVLGSLKKDGLLFYSTCTFNREENEEIGDWLVSQFALEPIEIQFNEAWGLKLRRGKESIVHMCYPHRVMGEGFSFQIFRKVSGTEDKLQRKARTQKNLFSSIPVNKFIETWIHNPEQFQYLEYDDGSVQMINLQTLKILGQLNWKDQKTKPGTKIATKKGKDWIPDHDLAISVHLNPDVPVIDLDLKSARMYLKGEVPNVPDMSQNAWKIARFECVNLGWLKQIGNRYNNYFPKNRRIRMNLPD